MAFIVVPKRPGIFGYVTGDLPEAGDSATGDKSVPAVLGSALRGPSGSLADSRLSKEVRELAKEARPPVLVVRHLLDA